MGVHSENTYVSFGLNQTHLQGDFNPQAKKKSRLFTIADHLWWDTQYLRLGVVREKELICRSHEKN